MVKKICLSRGVSVLLSFLSSLEFVYILRRRLAGIKFRACIFSKIVSQLVSLVIMCRGVSQPCQYTMTEYDTDNRRTFLLKFVMYLLLQLLLVYERICDCSVPSIEGSGIDFQQRREISLPQRVQTDSWTHPASYPMRS